MKKLVCLITALLVLACCSFAQDVSVAEGSEPQASVPESAAPVCFGESRTSFDTKNINRTGNLKLAVQKINGKVIQPGEVFSYNKTLGRRTAEAGYKEAIVFSGGKQVRDLGGGICQVSSTLFSAALLSGMEILSRRSHSQKVAYITPGLDAMVYYGSQDFSFRNNLRCPVQIRAEIKGSSMTVSLWGEGACKRKCTVISQATRDGKKAVVKRIVETQGGQKTDYTSQSSYGSSSETKYVVVKKLTNNVAGAQGSGPAAAPPASAAEAPQPYEPIAGDGNEGLGFE